MTPDEILLAINRLAIGERCELLKCLHSNYPGNLPSSVAHGTQDVASDKSRGRQVEAYICGLVVGTQLTAESPFDVEAADGTRLEVKYSRLDAGRGASRSARYWTWSNVLGASRGKEYEQLILVAEPNPACRAAYPDPTGEHVLFDVPFKDLPQLMDVKHNQIFLNSDRSSIWKSKEKSLRLYSFLVTPQQLTSRYGSHD